MKKAFIKLHIAVFLAGFTGVFGKIIQLDEFVLVLYRVLLTSLVLFLILAVKKKFESVSRKDLTKLLLMGSVIAIHWVLFYGSIIKSNISVGVVCFSLVGFFTALLEPLIMRRKFSWTELFLSLIVVAGILLIFSFDTQYRVGIMMGTASAALAAVFGVYNKKFGNTCSPTNLFFYEMVGGSITLLALIPLYMQFAPVVKFSVNWIDVTSLIILASLCTVIPFIFQIQVLKQIRAFTVNLTFNFEPIYSIIIAFIFFGEARELSIYFYLGLFLIILSVILQTYLQSREKNV